MKHWMIAIGLLFIISPYLTADHHEGTALVSAELTDSTDYYYQQIDDSDPAMDASLLSNTAVSYDTLFLILLVCIVPSLLLGNGHLLAVFYQSNYLITCRHSS
ncbi:hypothetical protein [Gracilibacillus phocaeensis]|uniref:hypothetical protein n=1 Tax=Gracilibacillus phocaeensis TaxID=2042304 RepID=UPI00102F9DC2|nr:hypothetical protein [Gracilibacillus phocaeensis]